MQTDSVNLTYPQGFRTDPKKDRRLGELNEKIKRKAHVKQSFSLDFLERGTFTEYPYPAKTLQRHK